MFHGVPSCCTGSYYVKSVVLLMRNQHLLRGASRNTPVLRGARHGLSWHCTKHHIHTLRVSIMTNFMMTHILTSCNVSCAPVKVSCSIMVAHGVRCITRQPLQKRQADHSNKGYTARFAFGDRLLELHCMGGSCSSRDALVVVHESSCSSKKCLAFSLHFRQSFMKLHHASWWFMLHLGRS